MLNFIKFNSSNRIKHETFKNHSDRSNCTHCYYLHRRNVSSQNLLGKQVYKHCRKRHSGLQKHRQLQQFPTVEPLV